MAGNALTGARNQLCLTCKAGTSSFLLYFARKHRIGQYIKKTILYNNFCFLLYFIRVSLEKTVILTQLYWLPSILTTEFKKITMCPRWKQSNKNAYNQISNLLNQIEKSNIFLLIYVWVTSKGASFLYLNYGLCPFICLVYLGCADQTGTKSVSVTRFLTTVPHNFWSMRLLARSLVSGGFSSISMRLALGVMQMHPPLAC